MSGKSKIEWTERTWNPIVGCTIISPGCKNCYAMRQAGRLLDGNAKTPHYAGTTKEVNGHTVWTGHVALASDRILEQPLRWKTPSRIFVNSMSDLFHDAVRWETVAEIIGIGIAAHHLNGHTLQILTKRADRMREMLAEESFWHLANSHAESEVMARVDPLSRRRDDARATLDEYGPDDPPPGIWLGVSVETQYWADQRIPHLLETPTVMPWISAEPLLGELDLYPYLNPPNKWPNDWANNYPFSYPKRLLKWVVLGGESGSSARPMHWKWEEQVRKQCADAGVAYFRKQWGEWKPIAAMLEEEHVRLYKSNRRARPYENREAIDDIYGKHCIVETTVMHRDGSLHNRQEFGDYDGPDPMLMFKVGKKAAGSAHNGIEHQAYPEAA